MSKALDRRIRRMAIGGLSACDGRTFQLQYIPGRSVWQGAILGADGQVQELWETRTIYTLSKIAVGYYPRLYRAFGPRRQLARYGKD